jgi:cysteine desulfurase
MKVYLDNAATTKIDPVVLEEMMPYFTEFFGNPSSIHAFGRKPKSAIEKARKAVAKYLNASTSEIFFTSGGTESNNMIIKRSITDLGVQRIITSPAEHHCVLHSTEAVEKLGIHVDYVKLDNKGNVDYNHLEELLANDSRKTLVTIMHANNEIGSMTDMEKIAELCAKYNAYYHSDTVQTIGYFPFDVQKTKVHFLSGASHKFHGPKGCGFIYISSGAMVKPYLDGGAQERNMRAGTENIYGIVGLGRALELAAENMQANREHIEALKKHMISRLQEEIPGVKFNGDVENGHYRVLNVALPPNGKSDLMLFNLDIAGIAASAGSACSSGSDIGSHVLKSINADPACSNIRFSFSRFNTMDEIDYAVDKLKEIMEIKVEEKVG